MRSPREFLSGEFLKVKNTRRLSTEYPLELQQVPGPIESTVCYFFFSITPSKPLTAAVTAA